MTHRNGQMVPQEMVEKLAHELHSHISAEGGRLEFIAQELAEIKAMQTAFFIPPKEHYDAHKKLEGIAKNYDKLANRIGSIVIAVVLAGFAAVGAVGLILRKL